MNWYCKRRLLILALIMCVTGPSFATDDCAICEEEEDPTLVNAGWPRCKSKKAGTAIAGQDCKECDGSGGERNKPAGTPIPGVDCKECDGNGGERNKPDGTKVVLKDTTAYCCGGILNFIGPKPDGCYEVVGCEWVKYIPDCKAEEDDDAYWSARMVSLARQLSNAKNKKSKMEVWCGCTEGPLLERPGWCLMLPPDSAKPPKDPCGDVPKLEAEIVILQGQLDTASQALADAKQALEDCLSCK